MAGPGQPAQQLVGERTLARAAGAGVDDVGDRLARRTDEAAVADIVGDRTHARARFLL